MRVCANGIELHICRRGQGPKLLVISGTGGDQRKQPSIFDALVTKHFDVLTYDERGLGRSKIPFGD